MQAGYVFLMSLDEVRSLSIATQTELAQLSPEFAAMVGIATELNPAEKPKATRARRKSGSEQTVLPEMNQLNQQTAIDPSIAALAGGAPTMPMMPQMPQMPSQMPMVTGIPGMVPGPSIPSPMPLPSMQLPTSMPPQPQYQPQPVAPQPAPPVQQPTAQQQGYPSAQIVRTNLMAQIIGSGVPDVHVKISQAVGRAREMKIVSSDISSLTDEGVPGFIACLKEQGLVQ